MLTLLDLFHVRSASSLALALLAFPGCSYSLLFPNIWLGG